MEICEGRIVGGGGAEALPGNRTSAERARGWETGEGQRPTQAITRMWNIVRKWKWRIQAKAKGGGGLIGKSTVSYPDHCRVHDCKERGQRSTQATARRWNIVRRWQWRKKATAGANLGNQWLIQTSVCHAVGKRGGRGLLSQRGGGIQHFIFLS